MFKFHNIYHMILLTQVVISL